MTRTAVGAHEVRVLAEVPACPSCNFYTDIEYGRAVATVVAGQPNTVDVALDGNVGVVTGSLSVNGTGASDLAISLRLRRACRAARAALVFAIRSGLAAVRRIAGLSRTFASSVYEPLVRSISRTGTQPDPLNMLVSKKVWF